MPNKVLIFGSCVSRDPFNDLATDFDVIDYYARSSFASLSGASFSQPLNLESINSKFQRRMIERDAQKSFLKRLEVNDFDLLVIDFTDDRFDLLSLPDGSLLTLSAELRTIKHTLNLPDSVLISAFSDSYFDLWLSGYSKIIEILKSKNIVRKAVINNAPWAKYDESGQEIDHKTKIQVEKANSWFERIHEIMRKDFPISQFCCYPQNLLICSSQHKWGKAPFHFCSDFEKHFINYLRKRL